MESSGTDRHVAAERALCGPASLLLAQLLQSCCAELVQRWLSARPSVPQANYRHQRHSKRASQLTRLKRWKPLAPAYASKLHKLGFKERYWAPPNPQASHERGRSQQL
jgi:hypothetical protein